MKTKTTKQLRVKSGVKAGIDTVPLPERVDPDFVRAPRETVFNPRSTGNPCGIGTWPTPE